MRWFEQAMYGAHHEDIEYIGANHNIFDNSAKSEVSFWFSPVSGFLASGFPRFQSRF